jgi:predicted Zn-dependent protease
MSDPDRFVTDAHVALPALAHGDGCRCALHARRRLGGALFAGGLVAGLGATLPACAQQGGVEGIDVRRSKFTKLVPAEQVEEAAGRQYAQMRNEAHDKRALAPDDHPQLVRLRYIAQRIIPYTSRWNKRAADWKWEVSLIGSKQINAFCMPGGKIAFYYGILDRLQLDDEEVAMVMGHEAGHALLEHAREQMGKNFATRGAIEIGAALFGLGQGARMMADMGGQLLALKFGREDESEADLVGMELAARAGYNPRAGVSLWQKMGAANKGAPPEFISTHPSGTTRIKDIQDSLPKVEPLYARAERPGRRFAAPEAKAG